MIAQELISQAYSAFNRRDIDAVLVLMSEHVSWPKASEGGRVIGKQEIRDYWTRQWAEFDPCVDVLEIIDGEAGKRMDIKEGEGGSEVPPRLSRGAIARNDPERGRGHVKR